MRLIDKVTSGYINRVKLEVINEFATRIEKELETTTLSRDRVRLFAYTTHRIADQMKEEITSARNSK